MYHSDFTAIDMGHASFPDENRKYETVLRYRHYVGVDVGVAGSEPFDDCLVIYRSEKYKNRFDVWAFCGKKDGSFKSFLYVGFEPHEIAIKCINSLHGLFKKAGYEKLGPEEPFLFKVPGKQGTTYDFTHTDMDTPPIPIGDQNGKETGATPTIGSLICIVEPKNGMDEFFQAGDFARLTGFFSDVWKADFGIPENGQKFHKETVFILGKNTEFKVVANTTKPSEQSNKEGDVSVADSPQDCPMCGKAIPEGVTDAAGHRYCKSCDWSFGPWWKPSNIVKPQPSLFICIVDAKNDEKVRFSNGHFAKLVNYNKHDMSWMANFNLTSNYNVYGNGMWYVGEGYGKYNPTWICCKGFDAPVVNVPSPKEEPPLKPFKPIEFEEPDVDLSEYFGDTPKFSALSWSLFRQGQIRPAGE